MRSGNPTLSAQRWDECNKWRGLIAKAVKKAKGNLSKAARDLKVTKRTLSRWIADDSKLRSKVAAAR